MSIDLMKENGFPLENARSRRHPAQTITRYWQIHPLRPNLCCIVWNGQHVNVAKTEYRYFNQNQTRNICTLTGGSLKLVDKFTYTGSSVLSTENDINMRLANAWTAIDRLLAISKSDLSDEMTRNFSKQRWCPYYYKDAPHGCGQRAWRKSLTAIAQECYEPYWINNRRTSDETADVRPPTPHL